MKKSAGSSLHPFSILPWKFSILKKKIIAAVDCVIFFFIFSNSKSECHLVRRTEIIMFFVIHSTISTVSYEWFSVIFSHFSSSSSFVVGRTVDRFGPYLLFLSLRSIRFLSFFFTQFRFRYSLRANYDYRIDMYAMAAMVTPSGINRPAQYKETRATEEKRLPMAIGVSLKTL